MSEITSEQYLLDTSNRPEGWDAPGVAELFKHRLFALHNEAGMPLRRLPTIGHRELDVYMLFMYVEDLGGFRHVATHKLFRPIAGHLQLPKTVTNAGYVLRGKYEQLIKPFEDVLRAEFYPNAPFYRSHGDDYDDAPGPAPAPAQAPSGMEQGYEPGYNAVPSFNSSFGGALDFGSMGMNPSLTSYTSLGGGGGGMGGGGMGMGGGIGMNDMNMNSGMNMNMGMGMNMGLGMGMNMGMGMNPPSPPAPAMPPWRSNQVDMSRSLTFAPPPSLPSAPLLATPLLSPPTVAKMNAGTNTCTACTRPAPLLSTEESVAAAAAALEQAALATASTLNMSYPVDRIQNTRDAMPWAIVSVQAISTLVVAAGIAAGEKTGVSAGGLPPMGAPAVSGSGSLHLPPESVLAKGAGRECARGLADLAAALGTVQRTGYTAASAATDTDPSPFSVNLVRALPIISLPLIAAAWPYPHIPLCAIDQLDDRMIAVFNLPRSITGLSIVKPARLSGNVWPSAPMLAALSLVLWPEHSLSADGLIALCKAYPRLHTLELSGLEPGALTSLVQHLAQHQAQAQDPAAPGPQPLSLLRGLVIHNVPSQDVPAVAALACLVGRGGGAVVHADDGAASPVMSNGGGLRTLSVSGNGTGSALFGAEAMHFLQQFGQQFSVPALEQLFVVGLPAVDLTGLSQAAPNLREFGLSETRFAGCADISNVQGLFPNIRQFLIHGCCGFSGPAPDSRSQCCTWAQLD